MKNNAESVTFHGIDIPETAIYQHLASCGKMPGKSLNSNYRLRNPVNKRVSRYIESDLITN